MRLFVGSAVAVLGLIGGGCDGERAVGVSDLLEIRVTADRQEAALGDTVRFDVTLRNRTSGPLTIEGSERCFFRLAGVHEGTSRVNVSPRVCNLSLGSIRLESGESYSEPHEWVTADETWQYEPGDYRVVAGIDWFSRDWHIRGPRSRTVAVRLLAAP